MTVKRKETDEAGNETENSYQLFVLKNNWFVRSQTEGADYTPEPLPDWNEARALATLNITKAPFDLMSGNVQGYAAPGGVITVSPIAVNPYKTLFHEIGHHLLGHLEVRGYVQAWAEGQPIREKSAQRVFAAANKILRAGTEEPA